MTDTEEVWLPREVHTKMIEALHTGMIANVSVGGEVSQSFSVTNGVKQGCVLAIFLSGMLDDAFPDMGEGVYIQSRQNYIGRNTYKTTIIAEYIGVTTIVVPA